MSDMFDDDELMDFHSEEGAAEKEAEIDKLQQVSLEVMAERDALVEACQALCWEMDYLESTKAWCIPSLGVMNRIRALLAKEPT